MTQTFPMTQAGYDDLKAELKHMKGTERPAIIIQIAEAREHGDLSENAEYHAAKERQGFIEARIKELDAKVGRAQIVDPSTLSGDKIVFGATLTFVDCDTEEEKTWTIVGDEEANVRERLLGISSPLARALIGKSVGEEVELKMPKGVSQVEVIKVEFR